MLQHTTLYYYLPEAYNAGVNEHPQKVVQSMGYTVTNYEGVEIADCVFIEVLGEVKKPLPGYMAISDYQIIKPRFDVPHESL